MAPAAPDPAEAARSALIVEVSEADRVVGGFRTTWDEAATLGVPAHVSVLVPFLPPDTIDPSVRTRLAGVFAGFTRFDASFPEAGWFGDRTLWLAPEPSETFRRLTTALVESFPDCVPYGGQHDEVVPHLTVAQDAGRQEMERVEQQVRRSLPIRTTVSGVSLWAGTDEPGSWRRVTTFRLG